MLKSTETKFTNCFHSIENPVANKKKTRQDVEMAIVLIISISKFTGGSPYKFIVTPNYFGFTLCTSWS